MRTDEARGGAANSRSSWSRLLRALVNAPVVIAFMLTALVMVLASSTGSDLWGIFQQTGDAAIVFTTALIIFSLTFGVIGVALLVAAGQRGVLAWASTGVLMGVVAAMVHGLIIDGVVVGSNMAAAALLSGVMFLLIRFFAGIGVQRPS